MARLPYWLSRLSLEFRRRVQVRRTVSLSGPFGFRRRTPEFFLAHLSAHPSAHDVHEPLDGAVHFRAQLVFAGRVWPACRFEVSREAECDLDSTVPLRFKPRYVGPAEKGRGAAVSKPRAQYGLDGG